LTPALLVNFDFEILLLNYLKSKRSKKNHVKKNIAVYHMVLIFILQVKIMNFGGENTDMLFLAREKVINVTTIRNKNKIK